MPNSSHKIARRLGSLAACLALFGACGPLSAQSPQAMPGAVPAQSAPHRDNIFHISAAHSQIRMMALDTRIIESSARLTDVEGFDKDKITVEAVSGYRIRVYAEKPGVTSLKLTDEFGNISTIEIFIETDTRELQAILTRLFPSTSVDVVGIKDGVVLRGWVTEPAQIPQIMEIANSYYETVWPQLEVAGASQVELHVKVMEVQRTKLRELGFNFLAVGQDYFFSNSIGGLASLSGVTFPIGGPPSPTYLASAFPNNEFQFGITGNSNKFQGFIKALQSESLAKILAEPVLVTTSGRPADLHSGGEFPVLVPQSFGNLSIDWREFGVDMRAVPIVLGNGRLRLDITPEVSERDFSNAVTINGLVVPGITSRYVNTQVEMRFGETLMIGGLISTRHSTTIQKVPFLGELPWIGAAFSRKNNTVGETELVILVTPQMVAPMSPQQVPLTGPGLQTDNPVDRELYIDGLLEVPQYGEPIDAHNPSRRVLAPGMMPPGAVPVPPGVPVQPGMSAEPVFEPPVIPAPDSVESHDAAPDVAAKAKIPFNPFRGPASPGPTQQTAATQSAETRVMPASRSEAVPVKSSTQPGSALPGLIPPSYK